MVKVCLNYEVHIRLFFLTSLPDKVPVAAAEPPQRKRIVLQPRSKPVDVASPASESESSHSEEEASIEMTEEAALKNSEDLKEFFAVRNLEEAEVYFSGLPPQHHRFLVDKIVESKDSFQIQFTQTNETYLMQLIIRQGLNVCIISRVGSLLFIHLMPVADQHVSMWFTSWWRRQRIYYYW